jgi:hypothetical protein
MASVRRSVWEIRFRALMQTIQYGRSNIINDIGRNALRDEPISTLIADSKIQIEILDTLIKRGDELEQMPPSRIYLAD